MKLLLHEKKSKKAYNKISMGDHENSISIKKNYILIQEKKREINENAKK